MRWSSILYSAAVWIALVSSPALADLVCEGAFSNVLYGRPGMHDNPICSGATSANFAVDGATTGTPTRSCNFTPGHFLQYELDTVHEVGGAGIRLYPNVDVMWGPAAAFQNIQLRLYDGDPFSNPAVWISGLVAYDPLNPAAPVVVPVPSVRADHIRITKVASGGGAFGFAVVEVELEGRPCVEATLVPALSARSAAVLLALLFAFGWAALWMGRLRARPY